MTIESSALPSRSELLELFKYERDTGKLYARKPRARCIEGREVGGLFYNKTRGNPIPYRRVCVKYKMYLVHRIVWAMENGEIPAGFIIDHINGDTLNNKLSNLRVVLPAENAKNSAIRSDCTGIYGVPFDKRKNRWRPGIGGGGGKEKKYLGSFVCLGRAIKARKEALAKHGYHQNHGRSAA